MHRRMLSRSKGAPQVQIGRSSVKIAMSACEAMEDAGMVVMTMRTMTIKLIRLIRTMVEDETNVMWRSRSRDARTKGRWTCQSRVWSATARGSGSVASERDE
jgi:hypothetical protein